MSAQKGTKELSGLALLIAAAGWVLIYAGIKNATVLDTLRALARGQQPQSRASDLDPARTGVIRSLKASIGSAVGGAADQLASGLAAGQHHFNVGPVKPWVQAAADEIGSRFQLTDIGGWRAQDPFPDHPAGLALDFMLSSRGPSTLGTATAVGDQLAQYVIDNAARLKVEYMIWNRRSWNPTRGTWVPYSDTSNPHTDHVHVKFLAS